MTKAKIEDDTLSQFGGVEIEQLPAIAEQVSYMPTPSMPHGHTVVGAQPVAVKRRGPDELRRVIRELAAQAGDTWLFQFPVADGGSKKTVIGGTIKMANDLAREFGNCDVECLAWDTGTSWMIRARFIDLETGFAMTRPFEQAKSAAALKSKNPERLQAIALQIGVSKAIRNVVLNALQTYTTFAEEEAKRSAIAQIKANHAKYAEKLKERLQDMGVDLHRIELSVGRPLAKWSYRDLAGVIFEVQAVQEGMLTIQEAFGVPGATPTVEAEPEEQPEPELEAAPKPKRPKRGESKPKAKSARTAHSKPHSAVRAKAAVAQPAQATAASGAASAAAAPAFLAVKRAIVGAGKDAKAIRKVWKDLVEPHTWSGADAHALKNTYDERMRLAE